MSSGSCETGALILGATGGMGKAVAKALAGRGYRIALAGRDASELASLVDECNAIGGTSFALPLDMSKTENLGEAVLSGISELGELHVLVNCAGTYVGGKAHEVDVTEWDKVLDVNFRAFVHIARTTLPLINATGRGAVICIGSLAYAGPAMQVAAKQALAGFCDRVFEDVREFGTKVCLIRPGFVNTPLVSSDRLHPEKMVQPEDIASTVQFVLDMPNTACPTEIMLRPQRSPYRST